MADNYTIAVPHATREFFWPKAGTGFMDSRMKVQMIGILTGLLLAGGGFSQVVPSTPKKFVTRPIGGGTSASGGVEVIPRDGAVSQKVKYTTHIVLSVSRLWTSTDGRLLEGKLIAFEDLIAEAPKGSAPPATPAPPESPTVTRDGKVRLLVKQKPVEVAVERLSHGDQEFIEQARKSYTRKTPPAP